MANTNSDIYANQIAANPTKFSASRLGGRERIIVGTVAITGADFDANGDTVKLCQLPSNAVVTSIMLASDALGTTQDVDIGLFSDEGAVIDANEFADNVSAIGAATGMSEYLGSGIDSGAAVLSIDSPLWERAGLTKDSGLTYDIVLTQTGTPTDANGDLAFIVRYAIS